MKKLSHQERVRTVRKALAHAAPKERRVKIAPEAAAGILSWAQQRAQLDAMIAQTFQRLAAEAGQAPATKEYKLSEDMTEIILIDAQ